MKRIRSRVLSWRMIYFVCRTDYPCEGCEQGRLRAFVNATNLVFVRGWPTGWRG